jgi:hypothetical protein
MLDFSNNVVIFKSMKEGQRMTEVHLERHICEFEFGYKKFIENSAQ